MSDCPGAVPKPPRKRPPPVQRRSVADDMQSVTDSLIGLDNANPEPQVEVEASLKERALEALAVADWARCCDAAAALEAKIGWVTEPDDWTVDIEHGRWVNATVEGIDFSFYADRMVVRESSGQFINLESLEQVGRIVERRQVLEAAEVSMAQPAKRRWRRR